MTQYDKLDLSRSSFFDILINYRNPLSYMILALTLFFLVISPGLVTDPTLRSGLDDTSDSYKKYSEFVENFGDEEFLLVACHNPSADEQAFLSAVQRITTTLENREDVVEVLSISSLRLFQQRGESFGNLPILRGDPDRPSLPAPDQLAVMKSALPVMDLLVSGDLRTFGILLRVDPKVKFDTHAINAFADDTRKLVQQEAPTGTQCRIIGSALVRSAIVRYNVQTGIVFGVLCLLIGTVVSVYVFKSLKITAVTNLILVTCVIWVVGLMALAGIPLNSTTALSFGFIPITTVEIVIHMVVRYHQFFRETHDKEAALKKAVRWLARPCFMCCATTSVGFGALMISSIPMVKQLGFIMSVGIQISFVLAMVLTPALFIHLKIRERDESMVGDWMDRLLNSIAHVIFHRPRLVVGLGAAVTIALFMGAPMVKSDTQILRMLNERTPEIKDMQFVEEHLTHVHSLEVMLEAQPGAFKTAAMWEKTERLEQELRRIPEVACTESMLPLLRYMNKICSVEGGTRDIWADEALIPQLLTVIALNSDGERLLRRHVNEDASKLHIVVRIRNSPTVPIGHTIAAMRDVSSKVMEGAAAAFVTGELTVVADQTSALIKDQIYSMIIAAILITVIMMIQMESVILGLVCLIPNIPPVAAVFGVMGWFGIPLDGVTVFAASVAIGLAVDNTIHYLTQLKREISTRPGLDIKDYVGGAYFLTARQIVSWSVVTMLGFLALSVSPFRPVVFFGVLGCSAITLGMFGDLVFIQSLIMSSSAIRNTIRRLVDREVRRNEANGSVNDQDTQVSAGG